MKIFFKLLGIITLFFSYTANVIAADSYRYMHVSIDTPWAIFVFLLFIILFPFVLSAILYWYFTFKKNKQEVQEKASAETTVEEENG